MKGISAPIFRKEEYGRLKPHLALMQDEIAWLLEVDRAHLFQA